MKPLSLFWHILHSYKSTLLLATFVCSSMLPFEVKGQALEKQSANPPQWWQTAICLPDDPYKTLVSRESELLYDYDGSFYKSVSGGFKTTIGFNIDEDAKWIGQSLDDARIPIVKTKYQSSLFAITQEAFVKTNKEAIATVDNVGKVLRLDGGTFNNSWAKGDSYPKWAASAAVNNSGAIHYQFTPSFGESSLTLADISIALGFVTSNGNAAKKMTIWAEGGNHKAIEPVKEFGENATAIYLLKGKDINRDGRIDIRVTAGDNQIGSTYLNAFWAYPATLQLKEKDFIDGRIPASGILSQHMSGTPVPPRIDRNDIILVHLKNTSGTRQSITPEIIVKSESPITFDIQNSRVFILEDRLSATLKMQSVRQIVPKKWLIRLEPVSVEVNQTKSFAINFEIGSKKTNNKLSINEVLAAKAASADYWISHSNIPFNKIQIPDPFIQALVESSVRNIWQAREIKNGVSVFQVGPTIYRGLWIVDGAFLLETATLLGAIDAARKSIEYTLSQQKDNGAFQLLSPEYFKENGIVIWTSVRHALLSQDKVWLEKHWNRIEKSVAYIGELRKLASDDPTAPWYGINKPGEIDGGLSGHETHFQHGEYSNAYWNLIGLKTAIFAANWLGKPTLATSWQAQYDSFYAQVRKAMARDMRKDEAGNNYVPIFMENATNASPQKAQWSFCQAVYPGQIFPKTDSIISGNLAMLKNTEQEGMVIGTGWMNEGIWNYFASFYGHAWLWQGDWEKAVKCLYAMANHASPTLLWREEHNTNDNAYAFIGDMPHNWASAEFVRLTTHLLAIDRGNELHLLEGFPREWAKAGMKTKLTDISTPFGQLTLQVAINATGDKAEIKVNKLTGALHNKIILHLNRLNNNEKAIELDGKTDFVKTIVLEK